MFPAKIYVGQIAAVFGIVIASTWGATQWTAAALGFRERLGAPWFLMAGYPVYLPWRLFWFAYEAYAPEIFEEGGVIAAAGGIAGALFAIINSVWRARQSQHLHRGKGTKYPKPRRPPPHFRLHHFQRFLRAQYASQ
jgi:type IV secretion system protein VirD4